MADRTRCYRRFPDGTRLLAVRRPEDGVWHAERVRADGVVVAWSYDDSLADVVCDLDLLEPWQDGSSAAAAARQRRRRGSRSTATTGGTR